MKTILAKICKQEQHKILVRTEDISGDGVTFTIDKPKNSRQLACTHCYYVDMTSADFSRRQKSSARIELCNKFQQPRGRTVNCAQGGAAFRGRDSSSVRRRASSAAGTQRTLTLNRSNEEDWAHAAATDLHDGGSSFNGGKHTGAGSFTNWATFSTSVQLALSKWAGSDRVKPVPKQADLVQARFDGLNYMNPYSSAASPQVKENAEQLQTTSLTPAGKKQERNQNNRRLSEDAVGNSRIYHG
ncbi:hypothetical protein M9H77_04039 [Catharanthus roseus]|uniref:Uncharacterized protein n=1 Tax=Catharanthus roseus TaxID=4058 RepID=A0ACC0CDF5_CATRO|nr:hypothetical protein M9H77_04039 [Catharanthus roseus]